MIQTAFFATGVVYLGLAILLINELVFLAPIKGYIWEHYSEKIILFSGVLTCNLFCLLYGFIRCTGLQHTGDKLKHLEKQLRGNETTSEELTSRIMEQK